MRIAFNGMLLARQVAGVQTAIANLASALARHGQADYTFYLPASAPALLPPSPRCRVRRCRVPARVRGLRILWEQLWLPRLARRDGADLLHAPGYVAPLAARLPVVITVYDLIALLHPEWCTRANAAHFRLLLPPSVRKAAGIIVPSAVSGRDLAARFPAAAARTRVIPLAVGDAFHAASGLTQEHLAARRAALGLPERFILFVGQLEPKKNVPTLLRAFRTLRDAGLPHRLVLAGHRGWGWPAVERTLAELGLAEAVVVTGRVADADLPALYRLAELFVFPSLYEGFGLPPVEAMACGVPTIVSDRGSLPEVAGDAARIVDPTDAAALARALHDLLTDAGLRARCVARGRAHAARYTWRATALATEAFYRDVLAARADAGRGVPRKPTESA